ncbi:MAG TPA: hypothetical protein VN963_04450 [bacterium]|jgi:hypothetical protein|nr:hypothetical protein [bacterium]
MAKTVSSKKSNPSFLKTLWHMAATLVGGVQPMVNQLQEDLEKRLDHYAKVIEKRLMILTLRGCALFMTFAYFGTGFLFVFIDYGGFPRGIACFCCGLISLVVLLISIQFIK